MCVNSNFSTFYIAANAHFTCVLCIKFVDSEMLTSAHIGRDTFSVFREQTMVDLDMRIEQATKSNYSSSSSYALRIDKFPAWLEHLWLFDL